MESSAPFFTFWGLCPPYFTFWGRALPPVLIFKYDISYRLLQNFNSLQHLTSHLLRVLVGLVPSIPSI